MAHRTPHVKAKREEKPSSGWVRAWVWLLVCAIPRGQVTTYGTLARAIGAHPRAVGAVLRANKNPRVPCHRVIASSGDLGGYNRGRHKKIELLSHEGVWKEGIDKKRILRL